MPPELKKEPPPPPPPPVPPAALPEPPQLPPEPPVKVTPFAPVQPVEPPLPVPPPDPATPACALTTTRVSVTLAPPVARTPYTLAPAARPLLVPVIVSCWNVSVYALTSIAVPGAEIVAVFAPGAPRSHVVDE